MRKYRIALGLSGGLLLGLTAAVALALYTLRVLRDHRPADAHFDHESA